MLLYNSVENKTLLYDTVFRKKASFEEDTELTIITGYIGFSTPEGLSKLGFKNTKVIIGMYGSSVSPDMHSILLRIQKQNTNIKFFYTSSKIHSKIYIWHKGNSIKEYAIGSANFSSATALVENLYRETLDLFPTEIESEEKINQYIKDINSFLVPIDNYTATLGATQRERHLLVEERGRILSLLSSKSTPTKPNIIGATTIAGGVSVSSGLNWGYSNGLPLLGDAYIAISAEFIKNNPDIILPKQKEENVPIEVLWDDGTTMLMLMEGNMGTDILYPKQISSYNNKSLLGSYLRKRIGEKINKNLEFTEEEISEIKKHKYLLRKEEATNIDVQIFNSIKTKLITKDMLDEYGRTTIDIKKLDDGSFYFDFGARNND
ncbi:TPA: NgoFVII family restriction endonuclease [Candidatus Nomurabacteria bacterium]|nr:MAG: hypothetical protein O210_OD1C00001G0597 [Parcubacteria bacterium RAAC4_OD1_1]HCY26181.1 NgoFVII family restriction endonuclease [Candidatus Nomurabacteria bacterium]